MSEKNVEIVRTIYRTFADGEAARLMELLDPEIEFLINPAAPEAGTYHGHEGVERWITDVRETLSEFDIAPDEFLDVGEQVICPVRIRVLGKASEAEAELRETHLWTITDGRAVRMKAYPVHAEALQAAGLRE